MLVLLSPSKTLGNGAPPGTLKPTQPQLLSQAEVLAAIAQKLSAQKLQSLMGISEKLAQLNHARYQAFATPFTPRNATCALYTFQGDVYDGLDAPTLSATQVKQAQKQLCILSGLYGLLRPLDLMQPYRLEMGIRLKNPKGHSLYEFWRPQIASLLNAALQKDATPHIINLASKEYAKAVDQTLLNAPMTQVVFKESRNGTEKIIGLMAKKARGRMARWIIEHQPKTIHALEAFDLDGYRFRTASSSPELLTFVRTS